MKKWGIIAALALLTLTGCAGTAKSADPEPETTAAVETAIVVPNVVGMKGDAAKAAIEAVGLKVDWSETVLKASNWDVDDQVPAAGTSAVPGAKILLTVSKPTESAAPSTPPKPSDTVTPSGLTVGFAILYPLRDVAEDPVSLEHSISVRV